MKLVPEEYRKLLDENVEIDGEMQVRAEWNWNNTQYLASPARRGIKLSVIDNSGLYKNIAATVGEKVNQDNNVDFFKKCFDIEENNRLNGVKKYIEYNDQIVMDSNNNPIENPKYKEPFKGPFRHPAPAWKDGDNEPKFGLKKHFSVIAEFHLSIPEEGWYTYKIEADDRYEVYLYDEQLEANKLVVADYTAGDWWYKAESRNGYIASYFGTPGRYYMKVLLQNVDLSTALYLSQSSPQTRRETGEHSLSSAPTLDMMKYYTYYPLTEDDVIYPDDTGPEFNPEVVGLKRILAKNTIYDKDTKGTKYSRNDIGMWNDWREYFSVDSIIKPNRPVSGINYNMYDDETGIAGWIGSENDFINGLYSPVKARNYCFSTNYSTYKYWVSDCESSEQKVQDGYLIPLADIVVKYISPVPTNKIRAVFNLGAMPKDFRILYSPVSDGDEWYEAGSNETTEVNQYTGEVEIWRQKNGNWTDFTDIKDDNSIPIMRIRLVVRSLRVPNKRLEVIEFGALKHIDITQSVESFSIDMNMNETEQFKTMGTISANSGSVSLSNLDKLFSFNHVEDIRRKRFKGIENPNPGLRAVVERQTKFTFDMIYKDRDSGEKYQMRVGTMYGTDWDESDDMFKIKLFDSAKNLQNIDCPDLSFEDKPIHYIIGSILDMVGFSNYSVDMSDFKKNQLSNNQEKIFTPVMKFFITKPDESVWKNLQEICDATYSAIYIDEYGTLQLITKDEITRNYQKDEATRQTIEPPAHVLRGQRDGSKLPNIIEMSKNYEDEANVVTVKFNPKKIKENNDPYNPKQLTDILWQRDKTLTLQAARLTKPLNLNEKNEFWIDGHQERAHLWPYEGRANINGEVIAWKGKEYEWTEYIYEKYVDVIVNTQTLPSLYEYEQEQFKQWALNNYQGKWIWAGAKSSENSLYLGFRINIFGLYSFVGVTFGISPESKKPEYRQPRYRTTTNWITEQMTEPALDRILRDVIKRKQWIYSEDQRIKCDENTGRGNAFQRRSNSFTGRIKLLTDSKIQNKRGRGADKSRYKAEHTNLPKEVWYAKKVDMRGFDAEITDGYWTGKKGSEKNLCWFPILEVDKSTTGDSFQTSIGCRRLGEQKLKSGQWAMLMKKMKQPVRSIGFRFRFQHQQALGYGQIGLIFGMSKLDAFSLKTAKEGIVPANPNDCNQFYNLVIQETSDAYNRASVNEVNGYVVSNDKGSYLNGTLKGIFSPFLYGQNTPYQTMYKLRNMNKYERDVIMNNRGYEALIERMKWYDVVVDIYDDKQASKEGELFSVSINGHTVGAFRPGKHGVRDGAGRLPLSPYYGIHNPPGTHIELDYVWSWSQSVGFDVQDDSRYNPAKAGYIPSFLESGVMPGGDKVIKKSVTGATGEFFMDDFGSVLHEIRDMDVQLDKGPGVGTTYYASNPNVKIFDEVYSPNRAKFSMVNTASHNVIAAGEEKISKDKSIKNVVLLYGYKITEEKEHTVTRKNLAAIKDRGEVKEEIDAKWVSTDEEAMDIANWVMQHFSDPKDTLSVDVYPDATYSVGDRVKILFDEKDMDPNAIYIINGIKWGFSAKSISCNLSLRRVRNNDIEIFDIDDPEYGILSSQVNLADSRDDGAMSEGGVSGLTLYGPSVPNPTGKAVTNKADESPTWKSRFPIAGMIYDTWQKIAVDLVTQLSTQAINAGLAGYGVPPLVASIISSKSSQMIHGLTEGILYYERTYGQ